MKKELAGANDRAKSARNRIAQIYEDQAAVNVQVSEATAALDALGAEPQSTDFEDAQTWQRAVFDYRFNHARALAAVQALEQHPTLLTAVDNVAAAQAQILEAENDRAALLAEHFGAKMNEAAKVLVAAIKKYNAASAAGDPNRQIAPAYDCLKSWQWKNVYGLLQFEPIMVSDDVAVLSFSDLMAELS